MSDFEPTPKPSWFLSALGLPVLCGIAVATCNVPGVDPLERQLYNAVSGASIVALIMLFLFCITLIAWFAE